MKNIEQNKKQEVTILPKLVKNNKEKVTLKISNAVYEKILYLCSTINNIEWSGILFYTVEKDHFLTHDIFPMNVGSSAYTEFEYSTEFAGFLATHPEYISYNVGLIHSHHNMAAFFSGTDIDTLREGSKSHKFYLSLIVNNNGKWVASVGIYKKVKSKILSFYEFTQYNFTSKIEKGETEIEEEICEQTDCVIDRQSNIDAEFVKRIDDIISNRKKEEEMERIKTGYPVNPANNGNYLLGQQKTLYDEDYFSLAKPRYEKENKTTVYKTGNNKRQIEREFVLYTLSLGTLLGEVNNDITDANLIAMALDSTKNIKMHKFCDELVIMTDEYIESIDSIEDEKAITLLLNNVISYLRENKIDKSKDKKLQTYYEYIVDLLNSYDESRPYIY
jgi:proteasome lid subunit RPN8/RPN11